MIIDFQTNVDKQSFQSEKTYGPQFGLSHFLKISCKET
jgi:hypothetical protein